MERLKTVSSCGYGYTRSEVAVIASDYSVPLLIYHLQEDGLMDVFQRWPELKVHRLRALEFVRAKSASEENVMTHFEHLSEAVSKYGLSDKPHLISDIDEKGISPNHTPPTIAGHKDFQFCAVSTGKNSNNYHHRQWKCVRGRYVPPFFIFAGKRWSGDLI